VRVRAMQARDLPEVLSIQSVCPEIAQWTSRDYTGVTDGSLAGWIAEEEDGLWGFIVARRVASDLEILNFAVRPERRHRGVGAALLRETTILGSMFAAERAFLEVRISNLAAIRFYERNGFEVTGRRLRYYSAPIEDALVLTASLRHA
jgi:[ribosomal protein S18]-alanine N-acetyltransferase